MQKSYALFDFDGTLIPGDSIVLFLKYCRQRGWATGADVRAAGLAAARYCLHLETAEKAKMTALRFLKGKTAAEVDALAADFAREKLLPLLRPEGRKALEKARAEGKTVLLISASPSFYLEPLKKALPIDAILATRMDTGLDGVHTALMCGENCKGVQKPLRLAEWLAAQGDRLDYQSSVAYGDSKSDMPMLLVCARRVLVCPKRTLRRVMKGESGCERVSW